MGHVELSKELLNLETCKERVEKENNPEKPVRDHTYEDDVRNGPVCVSDGFLSKT